MATDWQLVREVINATIDACEKLEPLGVTDQEQGDHRARWGNYEDGVSVGDFFGRFWAYPGGAQRDILGLRYKLGIEDRGHPEFGRALVNTARACAEIIGVAPVDLDRKAEGFEPHCGSAGNSMRSQLTGIGKIYRNWMVPEITKAVEKYRKEFPR